MHQATSSVLTAQFWNPSIYLDVAAVRWTPKVYRACRKLAACVPICVWRLHALPLPGLWPQGQQQWGHQGPKRKGLKCSWWLSAALHASADTADSGWGISVVLLHPAWAGRRAAAISLHSFPSDFIHEGGFTKSDPPFPPPHFIFLRDLIKGNLSSHFSINGCI